MIPRWSDLTATVRLIIAAVAAIAVIFALWWLYSALTAKPKAEARLAQNQAQAASQSGAEAVNVVGAAADREANEDAQTRASAQEIRNAQGADAQVAEPVRNAGLAALCRRAAYAHDPKCVGLRDGGAGSR